MRNFDYDSFQKASVPNDVVMYLSQINEYKGKQQLFYKQKSDILEKLVQVAKIQSTASSNRIEGIFTSDKRLQDLSTEKAVPRNWDEKEIMGYRFCLDMIYESHDNIQVTPNFILQFHGYMYRYLQTSMGGQYKKTDNTIEETDADGKSRARFVPVSAFETPQALDNLCTAYNRALHASSQNWHENRNDSWEFIRYMLGIILAAYREFENRVVIVAEQKLTKEDRIHMGIKETIGLFSKAEILEKYPDISLGTIERVMAKMKDERIILSLGTGRSAKWRRI